MSKGLLICTFVDKNDPELEDAFYEEFDKAMQEQFEAHEMHDFTYYIDCAADEVERVEDALLDIFEEVVQRDKFCDLEGVFFYSISADGVLLEDIAEICWEDEEDGE